MSDAHTLALLLGTAAPAVPDNPDATAWRAYFLAVQAQLLSADGEMSPTAAHARTLALVRPQYLAKFPAGEAEVDRLFTPEKSVPAAPMLPA